VLLLMSLNVVVIDNSIGIGHLPFLFYSIAFCEGNGPMMVMMTINVIALLLPLLLLRQQQQR
jgi:hypothetical protein